MKYIILIGDGMADVPVDSLNGRTPLEAANIPNMDMAARIGKVGIAKTVPKGMTPASDVANLSIMGYDPKRFYTGRGPLEAANMNIPLDEKSVAFRCNLVTISDKKMADYSAGHIKNEEAHVLIKELNNKLGSDKVRFHKGISYRHLVIFKFDSREKARAVADLDCSPPHDIMNSKYSRYLPKGEGSEVITDIFNKASSILAKHDVNKVRVDLGENPANAIWIWGGGMSPEIPLFKDLYGVSGAIISAVDLIKGMGKVIGFEVVDVPGATGYYDTNYKGKAEYAIKALKNRDLVYVHVEAPDEASHNGDLRAKITAIENFDSLVVGTFMKFLKDKKDYRLLIMPDHATPLSLRTHTADPIPFAVCGKGIEPDEIEVFTEKSAKTSNLDFPKGFELMKYFIA